MYHQARHFRSNIGGPLLVNFFEKWQIDKSYLVNSKILGGPCPPPRNGAPVYHTLQINALNFQFKNVVFESVKVKSVKIKKIIRSLRMVQKSFVRRFENDTFESVFFKSVEIESVVVSAHPL